MEYIKRMDRHLVISMVLVLFICTDHTNCQYPTYDGPTSVSISEAELAGSKVFEFEVSDPNDDPLTVTINHDRQFQLVSPATSGGVYTVILKDKLDREQENKYTMTITIDDGNGHALPVDVRIRVQDVNDYTPIFTNLPLIANVRENQPPGTFVLNLTAVDEDTGYGAALEIFILDETVPLYLGNYLTKEPVEHSYHSATVLLKRSLDYEQTKLVLVKVKVSDQAACPDSCQPVLSSEQTLIVNVIDVQDTPPQYKGAPYFASTEENLPIGTPIVTVSAVDGDTSNKRPVKYYFVSSADGEMVVEEKMFRINSTTGVISNKVVIDTDTEQFRLSGSSSFTLDIMAVEVPEANQSADPATDRSRTTVTINVLDLNDEKPNFSDNQAEGTIKEELPAGNIVALSKALRVTDPDQGINGTFSLKALNEDDTVSEWFSVSPVVGVNTVAVTLITKQKIDYERRKLLKVKLEAKEENTGRVSYCLVTVSVTDNNDNSPKFSVPIYNATMSERSSQGDAITLISQAINATDADSNSQIEYSISGTGNIFGINTSTGQVYLACAACLDRETKSVYYLNIVATDEGGLTDTAQLVIFISDINDNPPVFLSQVFTAQVNESSTELKPTVTIEASDLDEGINRQIVYAVLNLTDYIGVHMNGTIYLKQAIDAELFNTELDITVTATDHGTPALTSSAILRLRINDLNDNTPEFNRTSFTIEIPESTAIGQAVYTAQAKDADKTSPNNEISYSIQSGADNHFDIDSQTGEIKVTAKLDRDQGKDAYTLVIVASDKGTPAMSSQFSLTIKISDVNDENPEFTQNPYILNIRENSPVGSYVGTVKADDADLNSQIHYSIISTVAYAPNRNTVPVAKIPLSIDQLTGNITTNAEIDREIISRLVVTVEARDMTSDTDIQTASTEIDVSILDANDNPPEIRPVGILEIIESAELAQPLLLTKLVVVDNDQDGLIEFSISSNPDASFSINDNGELKLVKPVDRETVGKWMNITVVVQDGGDDPLSSSLEIPIFIRDINDNPPLFRAFESLVAIAEDTAIGTNITQVVAIDSDGELVNSAVQYRIISGALNRVEIDRTTGVIRVTGDLDRDTNQIPDNSLALTIEACDQGVPKLCTSKAMTVRITDVNDNSPVFTRHSYTASVKEIATTGQVLYMNNGYQVKADDIDAAPNGQNVEYTCCSPGNDTAGLFTVNSQGQIVVAAVPDLRGTTGVYKLTVRASDWGNPRRYGEAVVIVNVQDYNDHKPVLNVVNNRGSTIHKPEDSPVGSEIVTIEATDEDIGINAVVDFYFLTDVTQLDDYKYFYIDTDPAILNRVTIRQNTTFDRENKAKQYKFGLIGRDRGSPTLDSSTLMITVNIDDINDNQPYFLPDKQRVSINVKEEEVGVSIATVNDAQDNDERNVFCYYITGARNTMTSPLAAHESVIRTLFTIDPSTAEVSLRSGQKLDRETQSTYILVIIADDTDRNVYGGCQYPPDSPWVHERSKANEMELVINVEDINDTPPQFSQESYTLAVVRGVAPPLILTKLQNFVTDQDENDGIVFSLGERFQYKPQELDNKIKVAEPIKVFSNGEVKTDITFTDSMVGSLQFGVVATDLAGHSAQSKLSVLIINSENIALFTVSRLLQEVEVSTEQFTSMFKTHANWTITVVSIRENPQTDYYTDIEIYVIPTDSSKVMLGEEILAEADKNPKLISALHKYGFVDSKPVGGAVNGDGESTTISKTIIFIIVAVVLVVLVVLVLALCYIMRIKYKRKLKAAHAMAFDTHTLGYDIDPENTTQPISQVANIPGSNKHTKPGANPVWDDKEPSLNNFDWGNSNTAFERLPSPLDNISLYNQPLFESHRSANTIDDNAIDPLNEGDTQSCSSADSNDWRLDVRGNNLDCSYPPTPQINDDVINAILNEQNQFNCEKKFTDSLSSDKSSSDNTTKGHFNRLIMSDSVYGQIFETRRMPNGLETTEV